MEFWAEALETAVSLINLSPSKAIRLEVPQALWSGKEPTYDKLHIFRCEAYAFIPRDKRTKLAPHATKCLFLGYGSDVEFGYRLWDPENRKLIRSSDIIFNEESILSRNQQKIVRKKVSFEIATNDHPSAPTRNRIEQNQKLSIKG